VSRQAAAPSAHARTLRFIIYLLSELRGRSRSKPVPLLVS
jgi:hypothetical protein